MKPLAQTALADARQLMGKCPLFSGLTPEELNALVVNVRVRHYASGKTIFLMGSPGDSLMTVLSGTVGISASSSAGREIRLAIFEAGDFFGEIALFDGKERTANVVAITACRLAILERRDVLAYLKTHPDTWPKLVEALCARLRRTDQHIAEIALLQLPVRLAKTLTRIASPEYQLTDGRPSGTIRLSQHELGKIVGATRESVNRCLAEWQRSGIISVEDGAVTIIDQSVLEQLADLD